MSKKLFITGTSTDIGKTYVSALIIKKLKEIEKNPAYYKAAMSGNIRAKNGNLIAGDAQYVKDISKIEQPVSTMCHYVYEHAVSPHLASRLEGNPVELDIIRQEFHELFNQYDYITMEGSGGICCPLRFDEHEIYLYDIVKELNLNSIIVADAGLGSINSVVLTAEYMKRMGMKVKGIILNNFHEKDILEEDNKIMCEHMTGLKVIACVKNGDTSLDIDLTVLTSLYE